MSKRKTPDPSASKSAKREIFQFPKDALVFPSKDKALAMCDPHHDSCPKLEDSENCEITHCPLLELHEELNGVCCPATILAEQQLAGVIKNAREGKPAAIYSIAGLTFSLVRLLEEMAEAYPQILHKCAQLYPTWPVRGGRHPATVARNKELFDRIGLANELRFQRAFVELGDSRPVLYLVAWIVETLEGISAAARERAAASNAARLDGWSPENVEAVGEFLFFKHLEKHIEPDNLFIMTWELIDKSAGLPPLTPDPKAIEAWWPLVRKFFLLNSKGHPENIPCLRNLGSSREKHDSSYKGRRFTDNHKASRHARSADDVNVKSRDSNVRDGITRAFKRALEQFVNLPVKAGKATPGE